MRVHFRFSRGVLRVTVPSFAPELWGFVVSLEQGVAVLNPLPGIGLTIRWLKE